MSKLKFRQEALDEARSFEQVHELIRIIRPRDWILLSATAIALVMFIVWGLFGTVTTRLSGKGILLTKQGTSFTAIVYVPAAQGQMIKIGSKAMISPLGTAKEEGRLVGQVVALSTFPSTSQSMMAELHNENLVKAFSSNQLTIPLWINIHEDASHQYTWTSKKGPHPELRLGLLVDADIEIKKQTPISLLIPELESVSQAHQ